MAGIHVKFEISPEGFLCHLSEAAYGVALKHGFKVPFFELELDLLKALREVIRKDMLTTRACGEVEGCMDVKRCEPWSREAQEIFKEED